MVLGSGVAVVLAAVLVGQLWSSDEAPERPAPGAAAPEAAPGRPAPAATTPTPAPDAGADPFGREPGHLHYGHNHPPQGSAEASSPTGPDAFGRQPGHEHYGHNHP